MRASPSTLVVILLAVIVLLLALVVLHHGSLAGYRTESEKSTIAAKTGAATRVPPGTYVVEIGDPRCPHCRAMEEFFKSYGEEAGVPAYFCSVLNNVCADAFWRLYHLGATRGVPTIVACRDKRIGFIEVGELEDGAWWSQHLASMSPVEAGRVRVYIAGQPYKEIVIDKETVLELCNTTLAYSKPIS